MIVGFAILPVDCFVRCQTYDVVQDSKGHNQLFLQRVADDLVLERSQDGNLLGSSFRVAYLRNPSLPGHTGKLICTGAVKRRRRAVKVMLLFWQEEA